jgi:rare lipoprotein A
MHVFLPVFGGKVFDTIEVRCHRPVLFLALFGHGPPSHLRVCVRGYYMYRIVVGRFSCGGANTSRIHSTQPEVSCLSPRRGVRLSIVALTAVTLTACAQSSVITPKGASVGISRQTPSESNRTASTFSKKRASIATTGHVPVSTAAPSNETPGTLYGLASFYGHESQTASGEKFNPGELTAAHPTLPFGTRVRVTDVASGRSVMVRINDRGPFVPGRIVDVSYAAAETLGIVGRGVAKVKLDVVQ